MTFTIRWWAILRFKTFTAAVIMGDEGGWPRSRARAHTHTHIHSITRLIYIQRAPSLPRLPASTLPYAVVFMHTRTHTHMRVGLIGKMHLKEGWALPTITFFMKIPLLYFCLLCNGRIFRLLYSSSSKDDCFRRINFNARQCRLWSGDIVFLLAESHKVYLYSNKDCICDVKKSFLNPKWTKVLISTT